MNGAGLIDRRRWLRRSRARGRSRRALTVPIRTCPLWGEARARATTARPPAAPRGVLNPAGHGKVARASSTPSSQARTADRRAVRRARDQRVGGSASARIPPGLARRAKSVAVIRLSHEQGREPSRPGPPPDAHRRPAPGRVAHPASRRLLAEAPLGGRAARRRLDWLAQGRGCRCPVAGYSPLPVLNPAKPTRNLALRPRGRRSAALKRDVAPLAWVNRPTSPPRARREVADGAREIGQQAPPLTRPAAPHLPIALRAGGGPQTYGDMLFGAAALRPAAWSRRVPPSLVMLKGQDTTRTTSNASPSCRRRSTGNGRAPRRSLARGLVVDARARGWGPRPHTPHQPARRTRPLPGRERGRARGAAGSSPPRSSAPPARTETTSFPAQSRSQFCSGPWPRRCSRSTPTRPASPPRAARSRPSTAARSSPKPLREFDPHQAEICQDLPFSPEFITDLRPTVPRDRERGHVAEAPLSGRSPWPCIPAGCRPPPDARGTRRSRDCRPREGPIPSPE